MYRCSATVCLILVSVFWGFVDCQPPPKVPYVTLMGVNMSNHSYIDINHIGEGPNSLQCHTDLVTCCSASQGPIHRGAWRFPNKTLLPFVNQNDDIYMKRLDQRVDLRRKRLAPSGIYHCGIPTVAVHSVDSNMPRASIYVGLYTHDSGDVVISGIEFRVDSDLNGDNPQFTLTCISTGGPVTNVTWTRSNSVTVTEGTESILTNRVTAQYNHTLTVTGRLAGRYKCSVYNNKPSDATADYRVEDPPLPIHVMAFQEGLTGIRVTSIPHPPTDIQVTSYRITYTSASSNGSVDVAGYSLNDLITGLHNGETYTVKVFSLTEHFFSLPVIKTVTLRGVSIAVESVGTTTLNISWVPANGVTPSTYAIFYNNINCTSDGYGFSGIQPSVTQFTLTGLEEGTHYSITVIVGESRGGSGENTTITATMDAAPSAAPTSLRASNYTTSSITIQWGPVECINQNGVITGHFIRFSIVDSPSSEEFIELPESQYSQFTITGLTQSTTYTIEIAAINSAGIGPYSSPITPKTNDALSVYVDSVTTTTLTISWVPADDVTATSYNISYFNINCTSDTYNDIADISPNQTMHTLTGLQEGSHYSIILTVTLSNGQRVEDSVLINTNSTAPSAAPTSVAISSYTSYSITIQWSPVVCIHRNGDITGYVVQYTNEADGVKQTVNVVGATATETTIFNVESSTNYSMKVAAINKVGTGVFSHAVTVITHESVYLTLNDVVIPNHGYVVLSDISTNENEGLICNTNRPMLANEVHSGGNWYAPDGTRVNHQDVPGFRRNRAEGKVRLIRRANGIPVEGIYRCAVSDASLQQRRLYAGLYNSGSGAVVISGSILIAFVSDLNGADVWFTLTCISTGGPASTVTWTRDNVTITEGTETVLNDLETAHYTHTLAVTESLAGLYTCTVSNDMPSETSANIIIEVSNPVEELIVMISSVDSLTFSWAPPTIAPYLTTAYTLTCTSLLQGIPSPQETLMLPSNVTTATMTGLYSGVNYSCSIITLGGLGDSQPNTINHSTLETVPAGAPEMFEADAGERHVMFTWLPPLVTLRNGIITNYTLSCFPSPTSFPQTVSSSGSLTASEFNPNTHYSCDLVATNSQGSGPSKNTSFTTLEDYSYFQLRLGGGPPCVELISTGSERDQKLKDIKDAVIEQLSIYSCSACAITDSIIDEQYFACYPESPNFVIYRARIEGTSVTDSSNLVSLLEDWVKSGNVRIIVTQVLMWADTECTVILPSLTVQEECPQLSPSSSSSLTPTIISTQEQSESPFDAKLIIIGGSTAIILIIAITIIVLSIVCLLIVKHRNKDISGSVWRAEEHVMTELPSVTDQKYQTYTDHISTVTNAAYGSTKATDDDDYDVIGAPFRLRHPSLPQVPREYETPYSEPNLSATNPLYTPLQLGAVKAGYVNLNDADKMGGREKDSGMQKERSNSGEQVQGTIGEGEKCSAEKQGEGRECGAEKQSEGIKAGTAEQAESDVEHGVGKQSEKRQDGGKLEKEKEYEDQEAHVELGQGGHKKTVLGDEVVYEQIPVCK